MAGPEDEAKIVRPRQIYKGHGERLFLEARDRRSPAPGYDDEGTASTTIRARL